MNEEMVQNAMQIILHAGDARTRVEKALIAVSIFDFETAEKEMELDQVKITGDPTYITSHNNARSLISEDYRSAQSSNRCNSR